MGNTEETEGYFFFLFDATQKWEQNVNMPNAHSPPSSPGKSGLVKKRCQNTFKHGVLLCLGCAGFKTEKHNDKETKKKKKKQREINQEVWWGKRGGKKNSKRRAAVQAEQLENQTRGGNFIKVLK